MSLHDLHSVFVSTQNACKSINASGDLSLPKEFKESYARLIKDEPSFSRHNEAVWLANDILELHSRGNRTVTYIPSVFFFVAHRLVPLYLELQAYRAALVRALQQYNHTLDDTEEHNCVQYINAVIFLSDEEKHWLCKFVTDGSWWGKGRQIKRAQDFYESPLMQSASLTQETQSEVARITKQFAENPKLVSKLAVAKNLFADEPSNIDRLMVALKLFAEHRLEEGWVSLLKRDGYEGIRARYEGMNPETLRSMTAAEFDVWANKELWALQHYRCKQTFDKLTDEQRIACARFVAAVKKNVQPVTSYFPTTTNCPEGVGPVVATELLMKFHPQDYMGYSALMLDGMKALKLLEADPQYDTAIGYQKTLGIASQILEKMFAMKLPRSFDDEKYIKPDYITVNEFLWWVKTHQDLIREEIMESKMKDAAPTLLDDGKRKDLKFDPEKLDDILLLRLLASLRAKGFTILAGHSGTGKSRYVKKLAYMTCNAEELRKEGELPGNYLILQVKPNWHDSTELLGFRNAMDGNRYQKTALIEFLFKAYHYKDTPFFLCLDEMNLAPVEQYFAEFLSAMESEEPVALNDIKADESNLFELGCEYKDAREYLSKNGFSIPKNLFIVGTVNMDETTNQFSRKVLDRAFTIEMTDVDFTKFGSVEKPSYSDTLKESHVKELLGGAFAADKLDPDDTNEDSPLVKVQKALAETPFAIAYRFASEYTLLKRALAVFDVGEKKIGLDPLDQAVLMKILPRIAGEADYIRKVYGEEGKDGLRKALEGKQVSLEKIKTILKRAKDTNAQYITFWP